MPRAPLDLRLKIMAGLGGVHALFVVLSVSTHLDFIGSGEIENTTKTYANLSGMFRDYSFFAPGVASSIRAAFLVERTDGGPPEIVPLESDSREITFRYSCMIKSGMYDHRAQDLFAQSWSAVMFGRRADSSAVTVMVQAHDLPSMAEYSAGERPTWRSLYVARFERRIREAH